MSILLVTDYGSDVEQWRKELQRRVKEVDLRLWPDVGDGEKIEVILTDMPMADRGGYRQFHNLRWVSFLGHGVADIVRDPELPKGVQVTRLRDPFIIRGVSEYVIHAVTAHHLRTSEYLQQQRRGTWRRLDVQPAANVHAAVLGLGSIGSSAAARLRDLGFQVSGWSKAVKNIGGIQCYQGRENLEMLLKSADYLVSMLPSTSETAGLMNRETFAMMKPSAYFINVGRGSLVIESDLVEALDAGKLAGACLDVTGIEPLPSDSALWRHPRIVVTPHTGGTGGAGEYISEVAENYRRLLAGEPLHNVVDPARGY
jgi:glyoxylate/hydroxypyruvate reductase A